jgi:hypothetical protein
MALALTQAAWLVLLLRGGHVALFTVMACCLLAGYGGAMSSMPAFVADEFGTRHIGKIYGIVFTACSAAGLMGPYLFAAAKERFGGFGPAITLMTGLLCLRSC